MSFLMSPRPSVLLLAVISAAAAPFLASADPEAAGPSKAPSESLGNPQAGHFGNTDEGYFGNPDAGNFHNSQFPTVPAPGTSSTAAAAPSAGSKLSEGGGSPYVKLDAPPPGSKGKEISTSEIGPEPKHRTSHKPKKISPPET